MSKLNNVNSKSVVLVHDRNIEHALKSLITSRETTARSESDDSTLVQSIALLEILISAKNDVSEGRVMSSHTLKSKLLLL